MKKQLPVITLSSVLIGALLSPQVFANGQNSNESKDVIEQVEELPNEEKIGLGLGAIIGGILGGPPGAFITAIAGDFIAKTMIAEDEIVTLESQLQQQQLTAHNDQRRYDAALKSLEIQYQQEVLNIANSYEHSEKAQVENILVSLMFRTGSSDIEPHYQQQVVALAAVLNRSAHLNIDLSGYTDRQGDEHSNLELAQRRVEKVKDLLISHGVEKERIFINAFGESAPIDQTLAAEVNYFDRRVELKLKVDSEEVAKQANLK